LKIGSNAEKRGPERRAQWGGVVLLGKFDGEFASHSPYVGTGTARSTG
jgi:hypothetical protein